VVVRSFRAWMAGISAAACLLFVQTVWAARPADTLLPSTTKSYIAAPNVAQFVEQFNRSQLGKFVNDPALKPFVDGVRQQFKQQGLRQLEQLGMSWEELDGVPSGEVALAVVQPSPEEGAVALVVDVSGNMAKAEAVLAKIAERMAQNGAQRIKRAVNDPIIAYQLRGEPGAKAPVGAYFVQQGLLVASDNVPLIESMLAATRTERSDSLSSLKAYREVMSRTAGAAGALPPDLCWFVEPFGYAETVRAALPLREKRKGPDFLKILKNQGFTAVQGVGGCVSFSAGTYEVLHRTFIYAPATTGKNVLPGEKYSLAARMLKLPNGGDIAPQAWVPRDVSTYISFNCDLRGAFTAADTLVDELVGEKGVFHDVLDSLRDDPKGPCVDIEKNLIAHIGNRATIITDCKLPVGPKSERKVMAAEVTNEEAVADTIRKLMEADKDARPREFEGYTIWEIVEPESEIPVLEVETPGATMRHSESDRLPKRDRDDRLFTAVCVAQGHVFGATHIELLKSVLLQGKQGDNLGATADFQRVASQANVLGIPGIALRGFSRSDEDFRPTYDLIRNGQMPQAESSLGKILNALWGEGKEGARKQRIDGHDLPEFESVRQYFGPAGTFVTSQDDGWICVGFMLNKEPVVAAATRLPEGSTK
jgi:hypothetical protein